MTCTATPGANIARNAARALLDDARAYIIANRQADPLDALHRAVTARDAAATLPHTYALHRLYAAIPVDARANTITGYTATAGRKDIIALLDRAIAACADPAEPVTLEME